MSKMQYRMRKLKKLRKKLIVCYTEELKVITLALSEIGVPKNEKEVELLKKYIEKYEAEDAEFKSNFLQKYKDYLEEYEKNLNNPDKKEELDMN